MDHAKVVAHPLLIVLATLLLGFGLDFSWPLGERYMEIGVGLAVAGLALIGWAIVTMQQLGTDVDPYKTPSRLVVIGPFKWTRNPIYIGWGPVLMGVGIIFGTFWPMILLPAMYGILHYGVVLREEIFLRSLFGETYEAYCLRVRRWL